MSEAAKKRGDTMGELDGVSVRLRDVPKDRLVDWFTDVDGKKARPFRFFSPPGEGPVIRMIK